MGFNGCSEIVDAQKMQEHHRKKIYIELFSGYSVYGRASATQGVLNTQISCIPASGQLYSTLSCNCLNSLPSNNEINETHYTHCMVYITNHKLHYKGLQGRDRWVA